MSSPQTTYQVPWRFEVGAWLSGHGLTRVGHWLMARELDRMTAHLTPVERNTLFRHISREVIAEMEATYGKR